MCQRWLHVKWAYTRRSLQKALALSGATHTLGPHAEVRAAQRAASPGAEARQRAASPKQFKGRAGLVRTAAEEHASSDRPGSPYLPAPAGCAREHGVLPTDHARLCTGVQDYFSSRAAAHADHMRFKGDDTRQRVTDVSLRTDKVQPRSRRVPDQRGARYVAVEVAAGHTRGVAVAAVIRC